MDALVLSEYGPSPDPRALAERLGVTLASLRDRASMLGAASRRSRGWLPPGWTAERLAAEYPSRGNAGLASELGVSVRTLCRRAAELGLRKDAAFMERAQRRAAAAGRAADRAHGNAGWFRPGERANPSGEFRRGNVPASATDPAVRERMSRTRSRLVYEEKVRMKYGLPRATRLRLNRDWHIDTKWQREWAGREGEGGGHADA